MRVLAVALLISLFVLSQSGLAALFQDNLDTQTSVSPYTWAQQEADPALRTQSDPAAIPGAWWQILREQADHYIQVTNNTTEAAGGAYSGDNYLRYYRTNGDGAISARFAGQTGTVHAEWYWYIPTFAGSANDNMVLLTGNGSQEGGAMNDARASIYVNTNNTEVKVFYEGYNLQGTGINFTPNTWQKWEIDLDATDTMNMYYTITVGGQTSNPLQFFNPYGNTVEALVFRGAGDNAGAYVDSLFVEVPEPATIALLGLGGLALIKRRQTA